MKSQICISSVDSNGPAEWQTNSFKRILIGDSTAFSLPSCFTTSYKGSGGMYSTSAIKLYYEYDLLSGSLNCLTDANGVRSDQTFNEIENIHKGDLVMKDLGFYSVPFFREIHQKGAYFISRFRAGSSLYCQDRKITLMALMKGKHSHTAIQEYWVSIGSNAKERVALGEVRLILEKVPIAVSQQRIRRIKANYERKGRHPSKEQLLWSKYNIFITNIPLQLLPAEKARSIYRLRWQIEILFKTWKSIFHVNQIKPMQLHRFQCMLLSSLLIVLLFMPLLFFFKHYLWKKIGKEVSEWKMLLWLRNHLPLTYKFSTESNIEKFARLLFKQILQDGFKEKRKKKGKHLHFIPLEILAAA